MREWSRQVAAEAAGGRGGAAYGLVFAWHQGGSSLDCQDVAIYLTGDAVATSCGWDGEVRGRLEPGALGRVYDWFDRLQPFQEGGAQTEDSLRPGALEDAADLRRQGDASRGGRGAGGDPVLRRQALLGAEREADRRPAAGRDRRAGRAAGKDSAGRRRAADRPSPVAAWGAQPETAGDRPPASRKPAATPTVPGDAGGSAAASGAGPGGAGPAAGLDRQVP